MFSTHLKLLPNFEKWDSFIENASSKKTSSLKQTKQENIWSKVEGFAMEVSMVMVMFVLNFYKTFTF